MERGRACRRLASLGEQQYSVEDSQRRVLGPVTVGRVQCGVPKSVTVPVSVSVVVHRSVVVPGAVSVVVHRSVTVTVSGVQSVVVEVGVRSLRYLGPRDLTGVCQVWCVE